MIPEPTEAMIAAGANEVPAHFAGFKPDAEALARAIYLAMEAAREPEAGKLREALVEQTLLVDRLCSAVDQASEDIGHESIDDLLKLIGSQNERCIELLGGRTALSRNQGR